MAYTSFSTRKALGKRYGIDPAIMLEMERLNQQYQLAPGREARGMQQAQFAQTMAFNQEQADLNRKEREEANRQAAKSGMMGTAGNIVTTGLTLRALTKDPNKTFFTNSPNTPSQAQPSSVSTTQFSPSQIGAGYATAPASGLAVHGPSSAIPTGSSFTVTPSAIDMAGTGFGTGIGTGTAATEAGTAVSGSFGAEAGGAGGIGTATAAEGGASLAGAGSAALSAAPYAVLGNLAAKAGGKWLEEQGSGPGARIGRTMQTPYQGIGKPWVKELGLQSETTDTIFAVLNPIGKVIEQIGTVICTELHRQGIMSDEMLEKDKEFGRKQDLETIAGYHTWGIPLASLMRKSKIVTWIISPIAMAWAEDMAGGKNRLGSFLNKIGIPICRFIGRRALEVAHG